MLHERCVSPHLAPPAARTLDSAHKWCCSDRMTWAFVSTPPSRLLEHFRKHKYLSSSGELFALLVSSLLENLLDYRTIVMHDESKENRMSCTVNVLVGAKPLGWQEGSAGLPCTMHFSSESISQTQRDSGPPLWSLFC